MSIVESEEKSASIQVDSEYKSILKNLKLKIRSTQLKAAVSVNRELIGLYWHIGKQISDKKVNAKWGSKFIETISKDLQQTFPETYGFSKRNLERMRQFAENYPKLEFATQPVPQLAWGHICLLNQRVKEHKARDWYARQALENGWSRHTLDANLKQNLYERQGINQVKSSNFLEKLPEPQSQLAQDILKSPYNFDFLNLHDKANEREIENASLEHIMSFLVELGKGFAFVGNQVPLVIIEEIEAELNDTN